ncbi:MAG: ABC transporter permease [Azospirillaceae bacterium]|nr:ABC transporter permease [Azospirillaceae bacterium]
MNTLPSFLRRHLGSTLLSLFGLAVGIAAFLLVSLYVADELSVDHGFTGADRLYRVGVNFNIGGNTMALAFSPADLAATLREDFRQDIEAVTRVEFDRPSLGVDDNRYFEQPLLWADPNALRVLDFPLEQGDPATVLARPDGVVITRALGRMLFGDVDPMGRTVLVRHGAALTVTGILAPPPQSHLDFAAIAADAGRGDKSWARQAGTPWSSVQEVMTYVRVAPGVVAGLAAQLPAFVNRHSPPSPEMVAAGVGDFLVLRLDPVGDIYLRGRVIGDRQSGDVGTLRILAGVAVLILGVAIANHTNLATAQAINRAREVGIRKLVGARRRQLVARFTGEAVGIAALGTLAALAGMELCMPAFHQLVGRTVSLAPLTQGRLLPLLLATPLVVGVLGGFYPALVLSGYRPGEVLKGRAQAPGAGRVRSVLMVVQFAIAIALTVATLTVQRQVAHMQSAGSGYRTDNLYVVSNLPTDRAAQETLRTEVQHLPGVQAASLSSVAPATQSASLAGFDLPDGTRSTLKQVRGVSYFGVDEDFLATYGLRLVAGSGAPPGWRPDASDDKDPRYTLITEAAARQMGYRQPADAIGERFRDRNGEGRLSEIIGVVADVRFHSVRQTAEPLLFDLQGGGNNLTVRLAAGDQPATVAAVNALVDRLFPEAEHLRSDFADQRVAGLYRAEEQQAKVFATFGALAIVLANLGLFGLTALTAARRTKEIGVRRVVGAGVGDILGLLAWQFSRPVLLANLLAWPLAWWGLHQWLIQYAVRVDQGPGPFLAAGALALAVALATVAGHVIRVAKAPPVTALRYE